MGNSAINIEFLVEDPVIQSIVRDYWELKEDGGFANKVSVLAKAHELSVHQLSALMLASAKVTHLREICIECQGFRSIRRRSDYRKVAESSIKHFQCDECYEREWQKRRAKAEEEAKAKLRRVSKYLHSQVVPFSYSRISSMDAIYLLALIKMIKHKGVFDPLRVPPISSYPVPYKGDESAIQDLYFNLCSKNLLQFSLENPADYFAYAKDGSLEISRINDIVWMLAPNLDRDDEFISEHELSAIASEVDAKELCALWEDLIISELQGSYLRWYGLYGFKGFGFNDEVLEQIELALFTLSPGELIHVLQYSIKHVASNPALPAIRTRPAEVIRRQIMGKLAECVRRWPTWDHSIYSYDRRFNAISSNYVLDTYFDGDRGWKKLNLSNIGEHAEKLCSNRGESGSNTGI